MLRNMSENHTRPQPYGAYSVCDNVNRISDKVLRDSHFAADRRTIDGIIECYSEVLSPSELTDAKMFVWGHNVSEFKSMFFANVLYRKRLSNPAAVLEVIKNHESEAVCKRFCEIHNL